jgi:hypothetical protein
MPHRYRLDEFPGLIRREGGLVPLFMLTKVSASEVPDKLCAEVAEINRLRVQMEQLMDRVAEVCGYDEDKEN